PRRRWPRMARGRKARSRGRDAAAPVSRFSAGELVRRLRGGSLVRDVDAHQHAAGSGGVKDRMCRELGHEIDVHGHRLWTFPEPSRLAELKSFKGLFGRKVGYLNRLAAAALAGGLDAHMPRAVTGAGGLERLQRVARLREF